MATNSASNFNSGGTYGTGDVEPYIQSKVMPLVQRQLVAYQFGDQLRLPKGRGTTYAASRYDRLNLPFAPLSEGVPPVGESMPLAQVSAVAQQWGDKVTITDVAEFTIKHPLFQVATELVALQMAETLERNTYTNLLGGTQINYASYDGTARGSRAGIRNGGTAATSDVLSSHEINRAAGALYTIGAPQFMGQSEPSAKLPADKISKARNDATGFQHYVALIHPLPEQDMRENSTVALAWSYSDVNKLYNNELGEWGGMRFCRSNMIPYFVGVAAVSGTAQTTGNLATGNYYIQVTGLPSQQNYEQRIYQVSGAIAVTGPNGSISVTVPTLAGYVFNVYIGTTSSPVNLGLSTSGPTSGPLTGQAAQIASGSTITITGVGTAQTPPAAPATGITVFPTFIIGKNAYGQVMLDDPKFTYLKTADKSDPLNQLRIIGWKVMYGTLLENQNFFMRIESTSLFTPTFQ
jgi:N4-gp56 family major capsid protein